MIENVNQDIRNEVREQLSKVYEVVEEQHTDRKMTFYVQPKMTSTLDRILNVQNAILDKFGNPPFTMWSDVTQYRFTLGCN